MKAIGHDTNSDGDQDYFDNASCNVWKDNAAQASRVLTVQEFPGVAHYNEMR